MTSNNKLTTMNVLPLLQKTTYIAAQVFHTTKLTDLFDQQSTSHLLNTIQHTFGDLHSN